MGHGRSLFACRWCVDVKEKKFCDLRPAVDQRRDRVLFCFRLTGNFGAIFFVKNVPNPTVRKCSGFCV